MNYSQGRLVKKPFGKKKHLSKRDRRLRLYAFLTVFMGMLITLVKFILDLSGKGSY